MHLKTQPLVRGINVKKSFLASFLDVLQNLKTSYRLMTLREKIFFSLLILFSITMIGYKGYHIYLNQTVPVPVSGGEYKELIVGEVKYINPLLAQSDAEKSISKLLFTGLVRLKGDGSAEPDVASRYEISPNGREYTFFLRNDVNFSDSSKLTAEDVAYTIDTIKTPEFKSPFLNGWKDVETEVIDDATIKIKLPQAYGPFIYECDFGILPAHIASDDFVKKPIGSGMYQYEKVAQKEGKISGINLIANNEYYGQKPFIKKIEFNVYEDKGTALDVYQHDNKISAVSGMSVVDASKIEFTSSKRLALLANLRAEKLKDKTVREAIMKGRELPGGLELNLTTLDAGIQHQKADELASQLKKQGITLRVNYLNQLKFQEALAQKNYELLLVGFDFAPDRDPYTFWHSSQLNGNNYSGWIDKKSDILLEDARMINDPVERNKKYDQFFQTVTDESLAVFYAPIGSDFYIRDTLHGVESKIAGNMGWSRFENLAKWYINEKRVRKA